MYVAPILIAAHELRIRKHRAPVTKVFRNRKAYTRKEKHRCRRIDGDDSGSKESAQMRLARTLE